MSRSLSWFEPDQLRTLLASAGVAVRSVRAMGVSLSAFGRKAPPSTLVGQFGRSNRFASLDHQTAAHEGLGRFGPPVATRPGPPPPAQAFDPQSFDPLPFNPKATRLAAGATPSATPMPASETAPELVQDAMPESFRPNPDQPFEAELARLVGWALSLSRQAHAFVADREGLLLAEQGEMAEVAATVCPALHGALRNLEAAERTLACGHLVLERPEGRLCLVWANSPHGRLFLGLSGGATPTPLTLSRIADALRRMLAA